MPVYIYDSDAFEKLVEVEGSAYRVQQNNIGFCSFGAFFQKWSAFVSSNKKFTELRPEFAIHVGDNSMLYGLGGRNRYCVLNTGEIMLLKTSLSPNTLDFYTERAHHAGFRIFPDEFP
ncbi:MAG: hypothetical protein WCV80_00170 [Candidatus Paceibacterota bacterium]|jgi:hypothetical protein